VAVTAYGPVTPGGGPILTVRLVDPVAKLTNVGAPAPGVVKATVMELGVGLPLASVATTLAPYVVAGERPPTWQAGAAQVTAMELPPPTGAMVRTYGPEVEGAG
jgi:hypothetical protein